MTMDVAACIDPEIGAALAASPLGSFDFGSVGLDGIPQIREMMANMPVVDLPPTTTVSREVVVPATDGGPDPTVRVYSPPTEGSGRPCIYWIHGGGYLFGSGLNVDARINRWVEELDCVAVSIEYRLAPEDPYPAPLDDCYAGLVWAARNADELGIDPERIAIVGASAGGGLAAGLAIRARDRGEVTPSFQLLIYPMIDDTNTSVSSHIDGALIWSRGANELGWNAYLGSRYGTDDVPGEAAASRVDDVAGLPPAWIGVGFARRVPRRGRRVCVAPPRRRHHHRAAHLPGCTARLRDDGAGRGRRAGVSARHHGSAAAGIAADVRRRVHQLTASVSALTTSTIPAAHTYVDASTWRVRWINGVSSASTSRSAA